MVHPRIALSFLMVLLLFGSARADNFVFGMPSVSEGKASGIFLKLVYTEAFERLGHGFELRYYPAARLTLLIEDGTLDGEMSRVSEYGDIHPELIRVGESHYVLEHVAVSAKPGIHVNGWDSLIGKPYTVLYKRGIVYWETELNRVLPRERVHAIDDVCRALELVGMKRFDMFVGAKVSLESRIHSTKLSRFPLKYVGSFSETPLYAYMVKKHAAVAVRLAETLRDMKREGLFAEYVQSAIYRAGPSCE